MPKFIGREAPTGARQIEDNAAPIPGKRVRLTHSQAILLHPSRVVYSLDTTDRGGPKSLAKRWFRWFATPRAILDGASTPAMRERALSSMRESYRP